MTDTQVDDFLAHYGVPGMKWGKRRQKRLDRLTRVGKGTGSKRDKLGVALNEVSLGSVARNKGLKGAAASKAARMEQRKKRIQSGEAGVKDLLNNIGGDRLIDLG